MHAVLLGKVRRNGTSKAGKPYDFTACSVSYSAFGVEGSQVAEVIVDARMICRRRGVRVRVGFWR